VHGKEALDSEVRLRHAKPHTSQLEDVDMSTRKHRRLAVPIVLAVSVMLMAAPTTLAAGADVYGVGGGSQDFGTGTKIVKFSFSGHTGPQGDFGSYRWTIEDPNFPLDVRGDVDCVNVGPFLTGAGGWIGGPVTRVTPYPNVYGVDPGEENVLGINDLGNPSGTIPDEFQAYTENQGAFSQICKLLGAFSQSPISQGNITIKLP
jgi:hypothetical protein